MSAIEYIRIKRNKQDLTADHVIESISSVSQRLEKYSGIRDLRDIPKDDLNTALDKLDDASISIRSVLHDKLAEQERKKQIIPEDIYSIPADVSFDDGILRVFTMLSLTRNYSHRYTLSDYVKTAVVLYEEMHGFRIRYCLSSPYGCILNKHVHKYSGRLPDNNNEDAQIMNSIFGTVLLSSDAPAILPVFTAMTSVVAETEPEGVELLVSDVHRHGEILQKLLNERKDGGLF